MITTETVITASPDQVSCDLDGEAALLNLKSGIYYGLDKTGAAIWHMLQSPRRVSDIVDGILDRFVVDRKTAEQDLLALLQDMLREGLVTVVTE